MYHFFVAPEALGSPEEGGTILITGSDVNHIANVLRMRPGERLTVNGGEEYTYLCEIAALKPEAVECRVLSRERSENELPVRITLYQGLPKSDKLEWIIQKAVELGADRVVPVVTERTVVKLDQKKAESRRGRWQAIAESAAKQCGRNRIPEVSMPLSLKEALKEAEGDDLKLIPYECASGTARTRELVAGLRAGMRLAVMIGPEGGFALKEVETAKAAGFEPVSLGKRILRTETAGLAALSYMMLSCEE